MGLFSHLGDVVSGKNYKRNTLLVPNLNLVIEKAEKLKYRKVLSSARHWSIACAMAAYALLDYILFVKFDSEEEINKDFFQPFRDQIERLSQRSVYDMFKVLACHRMACSCSGQEFKYYLESLGDNLQEFKENVFYIWGFTREDKRIYQSFIDIIEQHALESLGKLYYPEVYSEFFAKGYGIAQDRALYKGMFFGCLLAEIFSETFGKLFSKYMSEG